MDQRRIYALANQLVADFEALGRYHHLIMSGIGEGVVAINVLAIAYEIHRCRNAKHWHTGAKAVHRGRVWWWKELA